MSLPQGRFSQKPHSAKWLITARELLPSQIVVREGKEAQITEANFSTRPLERRLGMGARDEMEAQRARAQAFTTEFLQKARRSKTYNRVGNGHCFPPEYPASHRESNRRIAQMHEPHIHPQWIDWRLQGENSY